MPLRWTRNPQKRFGDYRVAATAAVYGDGYCIVWKGVSAMCKTNDEIPVCESGQPESVQENFAAVKQALLKTNEMITRLERAMSEDVVRKISSQLLSLFNLIADSKESVSKLAREVKCPCLNNVVDSLGAYLDMIAEHLGDYEIHPIVSQPGDRFCGKYHEAIQNEPQFDPRSAMVKSSKRMGFRWGEVVLQKERVEI